MGGRGRATSAGGAGDGAARYSVVDRLDAVVPPSADGGSSSDSSSRPSTRFRATIGGPGAVLGVAAEGVGEGRVDWSAGYAGFAEFAVGGGGPLSAGRCTPGLGWLMRITKTSPAVRAAKATIPASR